MKKYFFVTIMVFMAMVSNAQNNIEGKVLSSDGITGLPGATLYWSGTSKGTASNAAGYFVLKKEKSTRLLVISFVGYNTDTIEIGDSDEYIEHTLKAGTSIGEVTVEGRAAGSHIDRFEPILTFNITGEELQKAACCNLSESFTTSASVDVNYSDAATGAKQIQLLGLEGSYAQIMTENYPALYGLASTFGLNYIPGPWMESIQVSKGNGSVRNGYESITGQINVEFKKPADSEPLFINGYVNSNGKAETNVNSSIILNGKLSTALFIHGEANSMVNDHNHDGFRDEPNIKQIHLFNRWDYMAGNFTFRSGLRLLSEMRVGGQVGYNRDSENTYDDGYGISVNTNRGELFTKTGFIFTENRSMSIGWIQNFSFHDQESWFGNRSYMGTQRSYYTNLLYQWKPNLSRHTVDAGMSYKYDNYDETAEETLIKRVESVPGAFLQYTYGDTSKIIVIAGIRADYHNEYGFFTTPRLHIMYRAGVNTTIRASAGKGYRTSNVYSENLSLFASNRSFIVGNDLNIEEAWNTGLNITKFVYVNEREVRLSAEFYHTNFVNQVVTDLDASPQEVRIYNLQGKSYSNILQVETQFKPLNSLDILAAFRWNDVMMTTSGELRERALTGKYKGLLTVSWLNYLRKWQIDGTITVNGPGRIPSTITNPVEYRVATSFDTYMMMNVQVTRFFKRFEIYMGSENLGNFRQPQPIVAPDDPFGSYFDTGLVWGPIMGRMIYGGFRFSINKKSIY